MADNPITPPLPADLPEQWTYGQTVGPNGTDVGLTQQHGYNYLMQQVNAAQEGVNALGAAFPSLVTYTSLGAFMKGATLIEDWNAANYNGFFMAIGASNAPTQNEWYIGYVMMHNDKYCTQRVYSFASSKKWYERTQMDGAWSEWVEDVTVTPSMAEGWNSGISGAQSSLTQHINDKNNPHGVTAGQVGADPVGSAAAVQAALSAHTGDKNNPHGVTAGQVGARPDTWTPSASDVGADPAGTAAAAVSAHNGAQDAHQSLFGERAAAKLLPNGSDMKALTEPGLYMGINLTNGPKTSSGWWSVIVNSRGGNTTLIASPLNDNTLYMATQRYSEAWKDWVLLTPRTDTVHSAVGTYTGTGTYGSSNRNQLTLDFVPQFLAVYNSGPGFSVDTDGSANAPLYFEECFIWFSGVPAIWLGGNSDDVTFSVSGNTVSWYGDNATHQCNSNRDTYYFFAMGVKA